MLTLAADTSLPILSVALFDETLIGSVSLEGKQSRNEKLLPAMDWLLTESGRRRAELKLLAVTRGPGSFTGVRVGLATIQGLAMALSIPVIGMSTHEAVAESRRGESFVVFGDGGRGEFYVSAFSEDREVVPPSLMSGQELEELKRGFSGAVDLSEFVRDGNVAILAAQRAARLAGDHAAARYGDLTPIYVRLAEAEVKLGRG